MNKFSSPHQQKGFTLIELLVSVVIIMVLTAISVVSYSRANQSSHNGKRQADMSQLRAALEVYRSTEGVYPAIGSGTATNANFLQLISSTYLQPYLASEVEDPINDNGYVYEYVSPRSGGTANTYELCYYLEPSVTRQCVYNP